MRKKLERVFKIDFDSAILMQPRKAQEMAKVLLYFYLCIYVLYSFTVVVIFTNCQSQPDIEKIKTNLANDTYI